MWLATGLIFKPSHPLSRKAAEKLVEFAIRTLSVSPTATATERTFSLENRIHTNQRASLSKARVQKLLFCKWNFRVMRRSVQRDSINIKWELERQAKGMQKLRPLRSALASGSNQEKDATTIGATVTDGNRNLLNRGVINRVDNDDPAIVASVIAEGVIFKTLSDKTVEYGTIPQQNTQKTPRNSPSATATPLLHDSEEQATQHDE